MKNIGIFSLIISTCICLTGCNSLTDVEKKELTNYVEYSNLIIETEFKNDKNKTIRLEPYRARYRVASEILKNKINK